MAARLHTLNSFYHYAASYGVTNLDDGKLYPLLRTLPPTAIIRAAQQERHNKSLNLDELSRFFAAIPRDSEQGLRDYSLFLSLCLTGRRISELLGLKYGDLQRISIEEDGVSRAVWVYKFSGKGHRGVVDSDVLADVAKAGIPKSRVSPHVFRHSCARAMLLAGARLEDIQHALRHRSIATTAHYVGSLAPIQNPGTSLLVSHFGNL